MKLLYTVDDSTVNNDFILQLQDSGFEITTTDSKGQLLTYCSTQFFDVIVIDATSQTFPWLEVIKTMRKRLIFTPIMIMYEADKQENRIMCFEAGADMCVRKPCTLEEFKLRAHVLNRRNTEYQSPTISFEGVNLNKPDGKICFEDTSLSVGPIEIEIFRLLTRATAPISILKLSKKTREPENKIVFFAECLQKKLWLLNCPVELEIKNEKCRLVKKKR